MTQKNLMFLLAAALVAILAVVLIGRPGAPDGAAGDDAMLWPGLRDAVNDISSIELSSGGDVVRLERAADGWQVPGKAGYPADMSKVRELLVQLADAERLEAKTANPENYARLGVADVDADSGNVGISLGGADVVADRTLIVGNTASRGGAGTYVRYAGEAQSWLASGRMTPATQAADWIVKEVADIQSSDIVRVDVVPTDGFAYTLSKPNADAFNFVVDPIPEGRELKSNSVGNAIGGLLASLNLDDVAPRDELADADSLGRMTFKRKDGLAIDVDVLFHDDARWASLNARQEEPVEFADETTDSAAEGSADAEADTEAVDPSSVADEAAALNARWSNWAYLLPSYKAGNLLKSIEDLLKAPPSAEEADEE